MKALIRRMFGILLFLSLCLTGCADGSQFRDPGNASDIGGNTSVKIVSPIASDCDTSDPTVETGKPPVSSSSSDNALPVNGCDFSLRFLAAGDNIVHGNVMQDAQNRKNEAHPRYNFYDMYTDIMPFLNTADISLINQETPMAGEDMGYSGYPNFNTPDEMADTIVELGFDIVNIATNHMLDKKEAGLARSMAFWREKDVLLLGAFENREDYDNIRVLQYGDLSIALLSYTYGTNGMSLNAGSERIIPLIDEGDIRRQVALAKEKGDLVFASLHWGTDSKFELNDQQKSIAALMTELGVDVIIGHHSHTIQPVEWRENSDGHRTLVIYSLGNLLSTMMDIENLIGGIVTFDIVRKDGVLSIENPIYNPVVCHYNTERLGLQLYMLSDYTDTLCTAHGAQQRSRFDLTSLYNLVTSQVDDEFLPDYLKS